MALTLYGFPRSRAAIPRWYLEEKGIAYTYTRLDAQAGEHRQPPFTTLNPFGKVPVLVDEGLVLADGRPLVIHESGAILLHLADRHGHEFDGDPDQAAIRRALASQWILFANATLAVGLFVPSNRERELPRLMTTLNELLAGGRSLMADVAGADETGPTWTVADCVVQAYLAYLPVFFPDLDLSPYANVMATIAATQARPAYQRVMADR